jgi:putative transposase
MAESIIGLCKTECVQHEGPWRGVDDLELATLNWVWWFNEIRLHSEIGYVPPTEHERDYYRHNTHRPQPGRENPPSTEPGAPHVAREIYNDIRAITSAHGATTNEPRIAA